LAVSAAGTLTDSGSLSGSTPLILNGTAGTAGGGGTITLSSAEAFSGALTIDGCSSPNGPADTTLILNGSGSLDSISSLNLLRQGTLEVFDSSGITSGRLSGSTALNLSGGTLDITGPAAATADESLGRLDLIEGSSTIDLIDGSGGAVDMTFASYTRTPGAELYFDLSSSSDRIYFTSMPAGLMSGAILTEGGLMAHAQYSATQGVLNDSVPEPASLGVLTVAAAGLLHRRKCRNRVTNSNAGQVLSKL
jgi:hypothetical protein